MWILLGTVFVASLLGSLHCVGMCGPFALLASANEQRRHSAVAPAVAYSLGRLSTYAVLGAVFGSLGLVLNHSTSALANVPLNVVQQTATQVAGWLMIAAGLCALARQLGWFTMKFPNTLGLSTVLSKLFAAVQRQNRLTKAFLIGALTCLMPCGWLYTFGIVAAGAGGPLSGAAVMIAFWAGTVPIMLALMLGFGKIGQVVRDRVPMVMAMVVIFVGCFTLMLRAPIAIGNETRVVDQPEKLIGQVRSINHTQLPCCRGESGAGSGSAGMGSR